MPQFRKKPVVIEAEKFVYGQDGPSYVINLLQKTPVNYRFEDESLFIETLEGEMKASSGDYIIRGVNGECYPCKPDIFEKTYEPASNSPWIEITEDTLPEETEPVLWATFPVIEPPEVASLIDEDFSHERFTHYRRMTNEFFN